MSKTWLNAFMCRCTTELTSHCLIVLFTVTVPLKNDFSFLKSKSLPDCVWAAELWHGNNDSCEAVSSALCHTWDQFPVTVSCDGTATETSSLLTGFQSNRRAFLFNQRRSAAAARRAELRASVHLIIKKQKQDWGWGDVWVKAFVLFGRSGLLEVPHLERVVFWSGDQDGLHGMEGQSPNPIKMTPQSEFGVPCFSHGVFVVSNLKRRRQNSASNQQKEQLHKV